MYSRIEPSLDVSGAFSEANSTTSTTAAPFYRPDVEAAPLSREGNEALSQALELASNPDESALWEEEDEEQDMDVDSQESFREANRVVWRLSENGSLYMDSEESFDDNDSDGTTHDDASASLDPDKPQLDTATLVAEFAGDFFVEVVSEAFFREDLQEIDNQPTSEQLQQLQEAGPQHGSDFVCVYDILATMRGENLPRDNNYLRGNPRYQAMQHWVNTRFAEWKENRLEQKLTR